MFRSIIFAFITLAAAPALACSCAQSSREEVIASSDVVFTGVVEKVERDGFWNAATVRVTDVAKGTVDEQAIVTTATNSAACGVAFTVGQSMEIAAIQRKDRFHTSLCSQLGLKQSQQ